MTEDPDRRLDGAASTASMMYAMLKPAHHPAAL
jgi:hypothetical protein